MSNAPYCYILLCETQLWEAESPTLDPIRPSSDLSSATVYRTSLPSSAPYLFSKMELHVLILGIDKAGKTTLLEKMKSVYSNVEGIPPDRIIPTVGLNIGRIEVANSKLVFWDLGGQPGLRSIWEKYYEEAHAVIFVIDASSPSRFEDAKSALEKVLRHEDLRGAPLLILANKQDLSEAVSSEELARYLDLKKLDERVYMFEAVSAYDGMGIRESAEWLVEVMERSKRTEMLRARAGAMGQAICQVLGCAGGFSASASVHTFVFIVLCHIDPGSNVYSMQGRLGGVAKVVKLLWEECDWGGSTCVTFVFHVSRARGK
ncbi:ADP-ribosylation factor-related protein 1, partial [Mucuna pruriens]